VDDTCSEDKSATGIEASRELSSSHCLDLTRPDRQVRRSSTRITPPSLVAPSRPVFVKLDASSDAEWRLLEKWMVTAPPYPRSVRRDAGAGETFAYPSSSRVNQFVRAMPSGTFEAMQSLVSHIAPGGKWNLEPRLQFNRNFKAYPHRDSYRNGGASLLLVGGNHTGGALHFGGRDYLVRELLVFDGRTLHHVQPFIGTSVSLVVYYDARLEPTEVLVGREPGSAPWPAPFGRHAEVSTLFLTNWWTAMSRATSDGPLAVELIHFKHAMRDWVGIQGEANTYPLKELASNWIRASFIKEQLRAGYRELDVLTQQHWLEFASWPGMPRVCATPEARAAREPHPPRLTKAQWQQ